MRVYARAYTYLKIKMFKRISFFIKYAVYVIQLQCEPYRLYNHFEKELIPASSRQG